MSEVFCDLAARARGLGTRLFTREELLVFARARDLDALATALRAPGRAIGVFEHATPADLDRAVRRGSAGILVILERWARDRQSALAVILDEEDRRSIRALIRGCFEGASSEARLRGLVPTSALPERALEELARETRIASLAARLVLLHHPFASALEVEAPMTQPGLLDIELALDRVVIERARRGAREGDRALRAHFARSIDLLNTFGALLAGEREAPFFEGGTSLTRELHARVQETKDRLQALALLDAAFETTALEGVFIPKNAARLEGALLVAIEREGRRATFSEPTGSAPILWLAARLRVQSADLTRIVWGVALRVPSERLIEELITP